MKIEIYFLNSKLTTEVEKDIKVSELLIDLKFYFKMKDANFILFDSNKKQLNESEIIKNKKNSIMSFYLIKSNIQNLQKVEKMNNKIPIQELIMKWKEEKKILEKKNNLNERGLNFFEFLEHRNNENNNNQPGNGDSFDRLLNLIQFFQESGIRPIRIQTNVNNGPIEADEKALRELQEMGFAEDRARQALINSRNDVNRATEILLGEMGDGD